MVVHTHSLLGTEMKNNIYINSGQTTYLRTLMRQEPQEKLQWIRENNYMKNVIKINAPDKVLVFISLCIFLYQSLYAVTLTLLVMQLTKLQDFFTFFYVISWLTLLLIFFFSLSFTLYLSHSATTDPICRIFFFYTLCSDCSECIPAWEMRGSRPLKGQCSKLIATIRENITINMK